MVSFTLAGGGGGGYMQQASAQSQSTPATPTLPFTPFSLQQQETVPEEEQGEGAEQQSTPTQEPPVTEETPPPAADDDQTTFQARPGQNVPLAPQPNEPTIRQGGDQSEGAGSNATAAPSGGRQLESHVIERSLDVSSRNFTGKAVSCGDVEKGAGTGTGGGFKSPTPTIQLSSSQSTYGFGWNLVAKNTYPGVTAQVYVVCAKITPEDVVNSTAPVPPPCAEQDFNCKYSGSPIIKAYTGGVQNGLGYYEFKGTTSIKPRSSGAAVARCQEGYEITGGGFIAYTYTTVPKEPDMSVYKSYPSGNGWAVEAKSYHQTLSTKLDVYAVCAKVITYEYASCGITGPCNVNLTASQNERIESNPRYVPLTVSPSSNNSVVSSCREGETITGGGFYSQSSDVLVYKSYPSGGNGWLVEAYNNNYNPTEGRSLSVYAMCARVVSTAQPITPATVPPPTGNATGATTMTPSTNDTEGGILILDNPTVPATNATGEVGGGFLILDNSTLTGEGLVGGAAVAPEPGGIAPPEAADGVPPTNDTGGATETSATEPPLRVEAIANATQAAAPATIRLDANITGGAPPYSYSWSVPDVGVIDQDRSITQMFFEPGTFTYGLTVTDSRGKVVTDNVQIVIRERLPTEGIVAPEPGGIAPPQEEGGGLLPSTPPPPPPNDNEVISPPEGGGEEPTTQGEEPPPPPPPSDNTGEEGGGMPPSGDDTTGGG
jgi:hypothetical protein